MRFKFLCAVLFLSTFIFADSGLITIGNKDKVELVYPTHIIEGPNKNIYIYDMKDSFIKVFSPEGKLQKNMAGSGEGPGYIKRAVVVNFGFTPDNFIYFTEYFGGHRWITLLKPDGSLHKTINPQISNPIYGMNRIFALQDGSFLVEFTFNGLPKKKGNFFLHSSPQSIYHLDSKGNLLTKIKETNLFKRISYLSRGADVGIPFAPRNLWIPYADDSILYTDGMDNVFEVLDYKGNIIGHIETELPNVPPIRAQDIFKWRAYTKKLRNRTQNDREWYKRFGKVIEEYKNPLYKKKPYIQSIELTPEKNILVSSEPEIGAFDRNFWFLNSKGKIITHSKVNLLYLRISPHYIFLMKRDTDENLMVYCLKRKKTEKGDLERLFRLL